MGIYRGGRGTGAARTIYHDEFRWADANSTYEDVSPGGKSPEHIQPISGTADLMLTIPETQVSVEVNWTAKP